MPSHTGDPHQKHPSSVRDFLELQSLLDLCELKADQTFAGLSSLHDQKPEEARAPFGMDETEQMDLTGACQLDFV